MTESVTWGAIVVLNLFSSWKKGEFVAKRLVLQKSVKMCPKVSKCVYWDPLPPTNTLGTFQDSRTAEKFAPDWQAGVKKRPNSASGLLQITILK
jgi:hypothetical protein